MSKLSEELSQMEFWASDYATAGPHLRDYCLRLIPALKRVLEVVGRDGDDWSWHACAREIKLAIDFEERREAT